MKRRAGWYAVLLLLAGAATTAAQTTPSFLLQGWYWDYPKTPDGHVWADTLKDRTVALAQAGFTHVWLPPFSRASFGSYSNGYDPKDLFDLGEFGGGPTGFGSRQDVDDLIAALTANGIDAVADVVYNHRDGGRPENNPSVEGWIENFTAAKVNAGDQPYPSDRFRMILPIGAATGLGAGTYYFKIKSASEHSNFFNKPYKVYMETNTVGFQGLPAVNESEPNGGGGCGEPSNAIQLGVDMLASVDGLGCRIDEFALTLNNGDFDPAGDTIFVYLNNRNVGGLGDYSDHYVYELYFSGGGGNIQGQMRFQTYTDFTNLPSGRGDMTHVNFKPNGNPTQLAGDFDAMLFFYDYDQKYSSSTIDTLQEWSRWLWAVVGIRGYRLDAVKHFEAEFTGNLLDHLFDQGIAPGLVVGEFFDGNAGVLKGWVDAVYAAMDSDTRDAIAPRVFDFSLRSALKDACDTFGYDARNVFNAGVVDGAGGSGFNVVTFVNNHDFRDPGQPVTNEPELAYAYIFTNNQAGLPSAYYLDYYNGGLKGAIDSLMLVHKTHIFGASSRDYLSRFSTPYAQNFISGYPNTTLLYQLSGGVSGRDVIVAINFAGETLRVNHGVNLSTMNLAIGDNLTDVFGRSNATFTTVDGSGQIYIELPARSFSVWVQGDPSDTFIPVELMQFTATVEDGYVQLAWQTASETENLGFHVLRSDQREGPYSVITPSLIPGAGTSAEAHSYSFVDSSVVAGNTFYYRLRDISFNGSVYDHAAIEVTVAATSVAAAPALPAAFALHQNYPNPFNPATQIRFDLPEAATVSLTIHSLTGTLVRTLVNGAAAPGTHVVVWDGHDDGGQRVASGIYLYRLLAQPQPAGGGAVLAQKKLVLMK